MLGKYILTPRQLYKELTTNNVRTILYCFDKQNICIGHVVKTDKSEYGNSFVLINDYVDNAKYNPYSFRGCEKSVIDSINLLTYRHHHFCLHNMNDVRFSDYIHEVLLLPLDFEKQTNDFINANKKAFTNMQSKTGIDFSNPIAMYSFAICNGSKNFFFWLIEAYFRKNVRWSMLKQAMIWNEKYGQFAGKLSKGSITSFNSMQNIMGMLAEMRNLRLEKRINDVINIFNTQQKKLLKSLDKSKMSKADKEAFSKFANLSLTKRSNFIKKMSSVEDPNIIIENMKYLTNILYDWNKESFIHYMERSEGIDGKIVAVHENIVLVEVNNYDTIKKLAKNTNWCISKNKTYWNNYIEHRSDAKQYMLFNFSKKEDDLLSIVGFTSVKDNGITNAHDFINNNLMGSPREDGNVKSYLARFQAASNIYDILHNSHIDLGQVISVSPYPFEWNKEACLKFIYSCVNRGNVKILADLGNKICLSIKDSHIHFVLGDLYVNTTDSSYWRNEHILFIDFNKQPASPSAFTYSIMFDDSSTYECNPSSVRSPKYNDYNASFNAKLNEYGLPYDIVRRIDNKYNRFKDMLEGKNIDINDVSEETAGFIKKFANEDSDAMFEYIFNSLYNNICFDYMLWIYNNNLTICDLIGPNSLDTLYQELASHHFHYGRISRHVTEVPSSELIDKFYKEENLTREEVYFVGYYLIIQSLIQNETSQEFFTRVCRRIYNECGNSKSNYHAIMLDMIADKLDFSKDSNGVTYFLSSIYKVKNGKKIAEKVRQKPNLSVYVQKSLNDFAKQNDMPSNSSKGKADFSFISTFATTAETVAF